LIVIYSTISLLLTGLYLLMLVYLIRGWLALKRPVLQPIDFKTKVTVMVAARNEEEKIALTIQDILAQDYPKHLTEIVFADDHSTDRTAAIIRSYAGQGVKILQMNEDKPLNSYKKKAITEIINLASGELMVATDADCRMGPRWLSSIVNYYETKQPLMIASPVTFFEETNLFENLQTLEFYYLVGMGAAFIGNNRASTCNGANLAYRRDIFFEVDGFKGIDDLASGDDELLLQKVAERYPGRIAFLKLRDAIVYTHAKKTLAEFISQRRRWASKSVKYKDKKIVAVVVGIWLFNISLLVNAALSFYSIAFFKLFITQFALKFIFETMFLLPVASFFKRPRLASLLIVISPAHIIYFVYVGLMGNKRKYVWKGRTVR
jgi:cellulose synthase/poly-beta-1,6-N-acetylglucosamine synthase-like glycosyltransferase